MKNSRMPGLANWVLLSVLARLVGLTSLLRPARIARAASGVGPGEETAVIFTMHIVFTDVFQKGQSMAWTPELNVTAYGSSRPEALAHLCDTIHTRFKTQKVRVGNQWDAVLSKSVATLTEVSNRPATPCAFEVRLSP